MKKLKYKKHPGESSLTVYGRVSLGITYGRSISGIYEEFFDETNDLNQGRKRLRKFA